MIIKKNQTILFQGDSITDAGRDRDDITSLGTGYAYLTAAYLACVYPELNLNFINKGIGGDRVVGLVKRWDEDCMDLKPDILSIMIGINDAARRFDDDDPTSLEYYKENLFNMLKQTKDENGTKIVICEPFLIPTRPEAQIIRTDLDPKILALRDIARELNAIYVPFDGMFAAACSKQKPAYWAPDGVHPSMAGHMLMAKTWVNTVTEA